MSPLPERKIIDHTCNLKSNFANDQRKNAIIGNQRSCIERLLRRRWSYNARFCRYSEDLKVMSSNRKLPLWLMLNLNIIELNNTTKNLILTYLYFSDNLMMQQ